MVRYSFRRQNMDDEIIIVQVKQGALRGERLQTVYNMPYVAFQGVPYAAPPIGELRFKDPKPPRSWEGIRDCLTHKNSCCIQKVIWPRTEIIGAEDCLYLNIYVPLQLRRMTGIAVMVWIHGGHYMYGSGNFYEAQPDYLMEKDIILITVNYRLGVFGFLNLNHDLASGNQGLKDQVAALQWIKENIAAFGGDPNNITIFGCNTGAVCVHLLMLSPLSKDLFHKAILQSGVATMNWAIEDGSTIRRSLDLAAAIDSISSNLEDVITSLKEASDIDIINAQYDILSPEEREVVIEIFGPSIDTYSERPFFPRPLGELLDNGNQKPVILGHTSLEYMRLLNERTKEKLQRLYNAMPSYTSTFLPLGAPLEQIKELGTRVQQYYFNRVSPRSLVLLWVVLRCYSDICFNIPIKKLANIRRQSEVAATYVYEFSYVGNHEIVNKNLYWYHVNAREGVPASTQYDDVTYLFYLPLYKRNIQTEIFPLEPETADFKMVQIMTSMWTNFAETGDPTPTTDEHILTKWEPATNDNFYYFDIGTERRLLTVTDYDRPLRPQM